MKPLKAVTHIVTDVVLLTAMLGLPVLLTGGVTRPEEAEELLRSGKADLIGVGRALFRDPHWGE